MLLAVLAGLVTGVLSGFGIGGGSLLMLYLTLFAGFAQQAAAGTNLLYFLACAPAALVSHIKNGLVEKRAVVLCVLAGLPVSVLASLLADAADLSLVRQLFGVLLLYIGVKELRAKPPKDTKP